MWTKHSKLPFYFMADKILVAYLKPVDFAVPQHIGLNEILLCVILHFSYFTQCNFCQWNSVWLCVCVVGIAGVKACCACGQKCAWQTRCLEMPYAIHCNLLVASCVELGGIYFLEFNWCWCCLFAARKLCLASWLLPLVCTMLLRWLQKCLNWRGIGNESVRKL